MIRVDLTRPPAHQCAWHVSANRIPTRRGVERSEPLLRAAAVGADADIAIVDAATVIDRSTYREPALAPIGIRHVLVNGVAVLANGRTVDGVTPGQPVRAPGIRP